MCLALHSPLQPSAALLSRSNSTQDVIPLSQLNSILSLTRLSEECDVYVPLFTPDAVSSASYNEKARQMSLLWHHLSLPYCRNGPNTDMRRMCNCQRRQRITACNQPGVYCAVAYCQCLFCFSCTGTYMCSVGAVQPCQCARLQSGHAIVTHSILSIRTSNLRSTTATPTTTTTHVRTRAPRRPTQCMAHTLSTHHATLPTHPHHTVHLCCCCV